VVNACIGAACFGLCYLWCFWKLILESGLLDEYFEDQAEAEEHDATSRESSAVPEKKKSK